MAQKIKGITIEFDGNTTKLERAMKNVQKEASGIDTELKAVNRALKFNPGKLELITQKQTLLKDKIAATKTQLEKYKKIQNQLSAQKVSKNSKEWRSVEREIIKADNKLKTFKKDLNKIGNAKIHKISQDFKGMGGKIKGAGSSMSGLSGAMGLLGGAAVTVGADFDSAMSQVQAISGATGSDFDALREKARQMGADTKFSATESADAFNYMAMAGWDTKDMLSGIDGLMALAAASGTDLATTSDIVTDALTALGYSAEDSGQFADVLASASANANTNVELMGETFKYAAPVAGALGYSMEDLALATGLMGNAGIKGSQAGTALRSWMSRMAKPTKEVQIAMDKLGVSITNADGTAKPFRQVMQELREKMSGLSETEKTQVAASIAGKEAMSGFLAVVNASDEDFNDLADSIDGSKGSADEMAKTMQDNFGGQLTQLKSKLSEIGIAVSDTLTPVVSKMAAFAGKIMDWFNGLSDGQKKAVVAIAAIVGAIGPLLVIIGTAIMIFGQIAGVVSTLTAVMGGLSVASLGAVAPFALIAAGIAAVIVAVVLLVKHWKSIKKVVKNAVKGMADHIKAFAKGAKEHFNGLKKAAKQKFDGIRAAVKAMRLKAQVQFIMLKNSAKERFNDIKKAAKQKFDDIRAAVKAMRLKAQLQFIMLKNSAKERFNNMKEYAKGFRTKAGEHFKAFRTNAKDKINDVKTHIKDKFSDMVDIMKAPFENLWTKAKDIIDKIKDLFPFNVKLPHITISPWGWTPFDLLQGVMPSLGIDWYKNGGIFSNPSVIGVGEAGSEAVVPLDKFWGKLDDMSASIVNAVQLGNAASAPVGDIHIVVELGGTKVGEQIVRLYDKSKKAIG